MDFSSGRGDLVKPDRRTIQEGRALETELHAGLEAEIALAVVAVREVIAEASQLKISVHDANRDLLSDCYVDTSANGHGEGIIRG